MSDTKVRVQKATALLREDHRKVKQLFAEYEKLGEGAESKKAELFETIKNELTVHAEIEEEIFYPAMEGVDDEETKDLVLEAQEEHKIVKTLLLELSALTPDEEEFDAKMTVLIENVKHHAQEEEEHMFPSFDDLPKERQDEISEQLRSRKSELSEGESR